MPFISCWIKVPCTIEDKDGKQVPAERQCGCQVACNMLVGRDENSRTWNGTCMACGAFYSDHVTLIREGAKHESAKGK